MADPLQAGEGALSKLQSLVSELFRIALCRNDDHNLASSTLLKGNPAAVASGKRRPENKEKVREDLRAREDERVGRETEIFKELAGINKAMAYASGTS